MDYTPKLSDQDVLERARDELNAKLPLEANGYICSGLDLWQILLGYRPAKARSMSCAKA